MHERIAPELTERAPLGQLRRLQNNPNQGDHATIREILSSLGQLEPIIVNRGTKTGRPDEIVSGNTRHEVMAELGWTEAGVSYVDLDEITLRKAVLAFNRARDKAVTDGQILAEVLQEIAAESTLLGTGYSDIEFDDLMADLGDDDPFPGIGDDDANPEPAHRPTPTPARDRQDDEDDSDDGDDGYAVSQQRAVVLSFSGRQYVWVIERLAELMAEHGVNNNSEAALRALETASGATAPTP